MTHKFLRWFASLSIGLGLAQGGLSYSQVSARSAEQTDIDLALPIQAPVLVLAYYPPDPARPTYLDPVETGWTDFLITDMQNATQGMISAGQTLISDATRYHGYKDLSAPIYLQYHMFDYKEFFYPIPRGVLLKPPDIYRPQYGQIIRDLDICNYVDVHGVKEVWMYGYHYNQIEPDESRMSSKYGDISNSWPKEHEIPVEYRLPLCTNSYVLYNFTYQPEGGAAIGNTVHNRMHQIEAVIGYADISNTVFWQDFAEPYPGSGAPHNYKSSCGNAHWAPNWLDSTTHGYRYDLLNYRENNCETWHPNDNQTTYVNANCTQWACTDTGFYKWFMQNLPGYKNGIVFNGQQMRNWWDAMYDFNQFIDGGRSLYLQASKAMRSVGTDDGWISESTENSNQGGTMNAVNGTFFLGDGASNRQYRSILHFNTSSLPDNAVITKVVLKIKKQGLTGTDPFTTHMKIAVDIRKGSFSNVVDLQLTDFQAGSSKPSIGFIANNPQAGNWYFANLNATAYPFINLTGITQFRLRFQLDDNNDLGADYLKFFSGDVTAAYRPMLIVTYYAP